MELMKLECPNCHAQLTIENGLDECFCQYCGTKILITGQSSTLIEAKTQIELANKKMQLEEQRHRQRMEDRASRDQRRRETDKMIARSFLIFFVVVGLIMLFLYFSGNLA